jgi:hypothetical protein
MKYLNDLPEEIRDLFDAFCDGSIDDEQLKRLEAYILSDEAARLKFVAYFHLHTELRFAARAKRVADSVLGTTGEPHRGATVWWRQWTIARPSRGPWMISAAACVLMALAYAAAWRWPGFVATRPQPVAESAAEPGRAGPAGGNWRPTAAESALAVVLKLDDARWGTADGPNPAEGGVLPARRLRLLRGRATLAFLNGVVLTLEGPADLELISPDRVFCHRGRLRARVPEGAEGFVVKSPASVVVDLGTEFGLNVEDDGKSRVMVFEGEAMAALFDGVGSPQRTQRVDRSKAFDLDPRTGSIGEAVARPDGFVSASEMASPPLVLDPSYPDAVLRSRPRGYWRFERRAGDAVPNEVPDGPPLRASGPVVISGAPEGNGYALFKAGSPEQFLTTDGLWELARDPGHAVELWFLSDNIRYASLVGLYPPPELNVSDQRGHIAHNFFVELTARNRLYTLYKPASVRFLHRWPLDPRVGNNIVSEEMFAPRRWHHVVAQKNGDRMELYFDGVPDLSMPLIADHQTVSCHLVIGRRTRDPHDQSDIRPFVGRLDELAIYEHPLSSEEVRSHFRLAARTLAPDDRATRTAP